jgi:RNA polymerase sigma-70 factor, ECF subfamily
MTAIAQLRDDVLERAQAGEHDAFAELVNDHEAMVYSLALHFGNDRGRAEEIAQDAFLQLYRSLGSIESRAHLVHWLRQVTVRRCIDIARRSRLVAVPLDAVEVASLDKPGDPFLARRMRDLIASLPEQQRAVVILRYQEDLDPSDICRIVGMPVNTVKSHLHRALQSLRRKLEKHDGPRS